MSITQWDIKEAAFTSDLREVEELILTNKGANDVGALSQAVNLRSLSLAFNSLASLAGLAPLSCLQSLNVSHNQIASLKGLQSLTALATLNASHNKVSSLAPLSALSALTDLWLQSNAVAAPSELRVLGCLPALQRLAIASNPMAKALPADGVRLLAMRLCPSLRVIDGRPVEEAERAASQELDLELLLDARGAPAASSTSRSSTSSGAASHHTLPSLASSGHRKDHGHRSLGRTNSFSGGSGGGSGKGLGASGPLGRQSAGAVGAGAGGSGLAGSARSGSSSAGSGPPGLRRKSRSDSDSAYTPGKGAFGSLVLPDQHQLLLSSANSTGSLTHSGSNGRAGGGAPSSQEEADIIAAALAAIEAANAFSTSLNASMTSVSSGPGSPLAGGSRGGGAGAGRSRRPPLGPSGSGARCTSTSQLHEGSQFRAVVDGLPRFDPAKLPVKYSPQRSAASRSAPAAAAVQPPPDAGVVEYEAKYGTGRCGRAVAVRRDGSAAAFWPSGDMAVTVDAEYGSGAGKPAEDAGSESTTADTAPSSYRMMAMYRTGGGVAVSWDATGGFVQYPTGGLMLMYSSTNGTGTCYTPKGEVTRRWRDDAAAPAPAIPQTAASTSLPSRPTSAAAGPPPTHIDVQLDPHLAVRFVPPNATNRQPPRLELYMCCDGVRQRLVCGRNVPGELGWDPPPSRPPGAGGSSTSGTASPYDSEPPTPGGSSAQRPPAIGEESNVSQLPPPAFLRNLARQGGAGTHRSGGVAPGRTSGPAGAGTMGAGSNSNGSGSAVGDQAVGFSSITASLAALTEGLQAFMARDRGKDVDKDQPYPPDDPGPDVPSTSANPTPSPSATKATSSASSSAKTGAAAVGTRGGSAGAEPHRPSSSKSGGSRPGTGATPPPAPPEDESAAALAAAQAALAASGSPAGAGGGGGSSGGGGIDSEVMEQLAAARRLAADSMAAAMAAASAAAALGSLQLPQ